MTATPSSPWPWRTPDEESDDLYPGLVVHDGRQAGSITVGCSRLPLWAFIGVAVTQGWDEVEAGWSPTEHYGFTADDLANFLHNLLEQRGEIGRLLLVLANAERRERSVPWWERKNLRQPVIDQLRRCLAALDPSATSAAAP